MNFSNYQKKYISDYRPFNAVNDDLEEQKDEDDESDGSDGEDLDAECQEGDVRKGITVFDYSNTNQFHALSLDS